MGISSLNTNTLNLQPSATLAKLNRDLGKGLSKKEARPDAISQETVSLSKAGLATQQVAPAATAHSPKTQQTAQTLTPTQTQQQSDPGRITNAEQAEETARVTKQMMMQQQTLSVVARANSYAPQIMLFGR